MKQLLFLFLLLLFCACASGGQDGTLHTEGRVFTYGFEQRVRNEDWNNLTDFDESSDDRRVQLRYRTRLWMKVPLSHTVDFHFGLNQETNQMVQPRKPYRLDEVMMETAYFHFRRFLAPGLSLKIGRQNLNKGEGFLLADGSPLDGSRSLYHNAAVLSYQRNHSLLEFIAITNPRTDRYLPRIHAGSRKLGEWNEQVAGVYLTHNGLQDTVLEGYFFHGRQSSDLRPETNPQYQPDRRTETAGVRVERQFAPGWRWTGEFAVQYGEQHGGAGISARAGYTYLKKSFGSQRRHYLLGGYRAFSGDDPSTPETIESWNPLFGRWPKYSELYLYTLSTEQGPGYWSNMRMWQGELGYAPHKAVNLRFTYYWMAAFHPYPGRPALFAGGKTRGDLPEIRLDYVHNRNWKGHIVYERLAPGSFYAHSAPAHFVRFEVVYTYESSHAFGSRISN